MTAPVVLVTRPPLQAESLCRALQAAGAQVIRLPVIDIEALRHPSLSDLGCYDWLVFTSPNAVIHSQASPGEITAQTHVAAVGAATAQALTEAGYKDVLIPAKDYSSEGLLSLAELQNLAHQKVLLIKGQGGRNLIASTLRERGAVVDEWPVYRRCLLSPSGATVVSALSTANQAIVTSGEILQRLFELTPMDSRDRLLGLQLVVPSARVVQMAQSMGFRKVCLVPSPLSEQALVKAVLECHPKATVPG